MRALKFRAWDGASMRYDVTGFEHGKENEMAGIFLNGDYHAISETPVMQFTGLLDKNGKEMYEGDIVRFTQHLFNISSKQFPEKIKEVMWLDWEGKWNLRETNAGESNFEVIGSIYQNPELIPS